MRLAQEARVKCGRWSTAGLGRARTKTPTTTPKQLREQQTPSTRIVIQECSAACDKGRECERLLFLHLVTCRSSYCACSERSRIFRIILCKRFHALTILMLRRSSQKRFAQKLLHAFSGTIETARPRLICGFHGCGDASSSKTCACARCSARFLRRFGDVTGTRVRWP